MFILDKHIFHVTYVLRTIIFSQKRFCLISTSMRIREKISMKKKTYVIETFLPGS